MRSVWKGIYKTSKNIEGRKFIQVFDRSSIITKKLIGKRVFVYNGKSYSSFLVKPLMAGLRFGTFSETKKTGAKIHQTQKKKKK